VAFRCQNAKIGIQLKVKDKMWKCKIKPTQNW